MIRRIDTILSQLASLAEHAEATARRVDLAISLATALDLIGPTEDANPFSLEWLGGEGEPAEWGSVTIGI